MGFGKTLCRQFIKRTMDPNSSSLFTFTSSGSYCLLTPHLPISRYLYSRWPSHQKPAVFSWWFCWEFVYSSTELNTFQVPDANAQEPLCTLRKSLMTLKSLKRPITATLLKSLLHWRKMEPEGA